MGDPRVVVIATVDLSDMYFANQLIKHTNVVGVFIETGEGKQNDKGYLKTITRQFGNPVALFRKITKVATHRYYSRRSREILRNGFGADGERLSVPDGCKVVYVEGRKINEPQYVRQIKALKPEVITVCGASILKEQILSIPGKGTLNLHGGLSQRYRGEWPTLWAVYNEEPEYVGFTVHYVSAGIDDGDIVFQRRCPIHEDDNQETLYVKVVKLGTRAMIEAVNNIKNGSIKRYPLPQKGVFYPRAKVTPQVIKDTWKKVENGVIRRYVQHPKEVELIGNEKKGAGAVR